jgi:hypothetical protein
VVQLVESLEEVKVKVDVILSDWMGDCLVAKSQLKDVLFARDNLLNRGGIIFPTELSLHVVGVDDGQKKQALIDSWNKDLLYGLDFKCCRKVIAFTH